jgi:translation initiation factor IF-3
MSKNQKLEKLKYRKRYVAKKDKVRVRVRAKGEKAGESAGGR